MGKAIKLQGVHHLCGVTLGIKVNVNPCEEIESMEKRTKSKLKGSDEEVELITSFLTCINCGQQFSFTYYEVD